MVLMSDRTNDVESGERLPRPVPPQHYQLIRTSTGTSISVCAHERKKELLPI